MIKITCDNCGEEAPNIYANETNRAIPHNWMYINIEYLNNEISGRKLMSAGKLQQHFCSKKCFVDTFFTKEEQE